MTTHDMQPETGVQPGTAAPMRPQTSEDEVLATHDMQPETGVRPETVDPAMRGDRIENAEPAPTDAPLETGGGTGQVEPPTQAADTTSAGDSAGAMLFADGELNEMRSRWTEVQSAFVDDPRDCVQKADGLVADVVDKLTAGFSGARAQLEEQWARGEEASTEDLRIALKRYREFFERLLAV
jgi:hypothetical protein